MANLPPFFGLNIGKDKIKLAQVRYLDESKVKLEGLGSIPSSVSLVANESEEGNNNLSNEIMKCVKQSEISTKNCVMSIPELSLFSRLLTLPKVEDVEVEESIHYALRPLIPVPIESVNISFLEVDEIKSQNKQTMVNYYCVAAPKTIVDRYIKVANKAGLNPLAIETESLAIARMVFFTHKIPNGKNVMILDIGAENTNLIIARNSVVIFAQSISTGSNSMTKLISSDLGMDESKAEELKKAYGLDFTQGEGRVAKAIEPIVQIMLGETSRTMTYLRERIAGESISSIYLTGGGAGLKNLDKYMKDNLNIDTILANSVLNFEIDPKLTGLIQRNNAREFNVAIGLSLKRN